MRRSDRSTTAARCGGSPARRRALPAAVVVLIGLLAGPGSAAAEEVFTSQAAAANATSSTWIPAPDNPAAVCIVDTGVDPNPDTTNVIARLSVDGGDPGDVDTVGHHGTLMAMIASAPYNGWGMVGAAPSVKVVSVRAKRPGESGFYFSDVLKGVRMCKQARLTYNIKVVSLSLGGQGTLDGDTEPLLQNTIDNVRALGISVVAAAGNHSGPPDWPASYQPVLAVGASDVAGARCSFSASGSGVDLFAPGCPQDVSLSDGRPAWASGTSESTAFTSGVLTLLRSLRPELSVDEADQLLCSSSAAGGAGPILDADGALGAAGLALAVADGASQRPSISQPSEPASATRTSYGADAATASPVDAPTSKMTEPSIRLSNDSDVVARASRRLPRPRLRSRRLTDHVLELTLANRPPDARTLIKPYFRARGRPFPTGGRTFSFKGDRVRTPVSRTLSQVSITYEDRSAERRPSTPLIINR